MKAFDLLLAALRAATLANVFLCGYKAFMLVSFDETLEDRPHEEVSKQVTALERRVDSLFRQVVPSAQAQRHENFALPGLLQSGTMVSRYCDLCIDQAHRRLPGSCELGVSDVCLMILMKRIGDDPWLERHFKHDGMLKPYDTRSTESVELYARIGQTKDALLQ